MSTAELGYVKGTSRSIPGSFMIAVSIADAISTYTAIKTIWRPIIIQLVQPMASQFIFLLDANLRLSQGDMVCNIQGVYCKIKFRSMTRPLLGPASRCQRIKKSIIPLLEVAYT